jgi:primosomal replication protein N
MSFITQRVKSGQVGEQCPFEWRSDSSEEEADAQLATICRLPVERKGKKKEKKRKG